MGEGNAAVQAVGRTFFLVTIVGYFLAGLAMFPAVIIGVSKYYFEYKIDRCSCVRGDDVCNYGADWLAVDIGWKEYTIADWNHTDGCPEAVRAWEVRNRTGALKPDDLDKPRSPYEFDGSYSLAGKFQKTNNPMQADESNGAAQAGDGVVAMQVVCSLLCIVTYRMLKASFLTNGSHCSIGLSLMTRINTLIGIGLAAALVSFWWLVEGRFGDPDDALTQALTNVSGQSQQVARVVFFFLCSRSLTLSGIVSGNVSHRVHTSCARDLVPTS